LASTWQARSAIRAPTHDHLSTARRMLILATLSRLAKVLAHAAGVSVKWYVKARTGMFPSQGRSSESENSNKVEKRDRKLDEGPHQMSQAREVSTDPHVC
jgi:hypothetical protein